MTAVVLVAAGSGQRLGAGIPKAMVTVAGSTLIEHSVNVISRVSRIDEVVIVAAPDHVADVADLLADRDGITVVAGGATRDESVRAGLAALMEHHQHVLIHDAARPFAPADVYERVIDALQAGAGAVVPAVAVTDTVKQVRDGKVMHTLDRSELAAIQTPQGFEFEILRDAHDARNGEVTDDAMLVERMGATVHVVTGSERGLKITTPFDLMVAEALQEQR